MLAGDATHIGISFRNANCIAIEKPEDDAIQYVSGHRPFKRTLLSYQKGLNAATVRTARKHMLCLAEKACSESTCAALSESDLCTRNGDLLSCLSDDAAINVVRKFIQYELESTVHQALAVFKILAQDAPLSAFLPVRYFVELNQALAAFQTGNQDEQHAAL